MKTPSLLDACSYGSLDPDTWSENLIELVSDPKVTNQELLTATSLAVRDCSPEEKSDWMDNLLEFCLWETGTLGHRLDLCDHLVRDGRADFDSPKRWNNFGGLLHVACEAANLEGISWALERNPSAAKRPGGRLRIGAYHALCLNPNAQTALRAMDLLNQAGAVASHCSRDGRSALLRCSDGALAARLVELGADPWALDADGYHAVGFWLEMGYLECALPCMAKKPESVNDFFPWGSMSLRLPKNPPPQMDRPLFISTCSPCLSGSGAAQNVRAQALTSLTAMGANPLLLDAKGRSLSERARCPVAFAHMERAALDQEENSEGKETGRASKRL